MTANSGPNPEIAIIGSGSAAFAAAIRAAVEEGARVTLVEGAERKSEQIRKRIDGLRVMQRERYAIIAALTRPSIPSAR